MDDFHRHIVEQKKSDTKKAYTEGFIYIKFKGGRNKLWCQKLREVKNMDSVGKPGSTRRAGNLHFDLSGSYTGPCILNIH